MVAPAREVPEAVLRVASEVMGVDALPELALRLTRARARWAVEREGRRRERDLSLLLELTAGYAESLDVETLLP